MSLNNGMLWMHKMHKTNLEGYKKVVHLGSDPELLQQAAAHIACVARLTNVPIDELLELFVFVKQFGPNAQRALGGMRETFRAGWREIFTDASMRINEKKYMSVHIHSNIKRQLRKIRQKPGEAPRDYLIRFQKKQIELEA